MREEILQRHGHTHTQPRKHSSARSVALLKSRGNGSVIAARIASAITPCGGPDCRRASRGLVPAVLLHCGRVFRLSGGGGWGWWGRGCLVFGSVLLRVSGVSVQKCLGSGWLFKAVYGLCLCTLDFIVGPSTAFRAEIELTKCLYDVKEVPSSLKLIKKREKK